MASPQRRWVPGSLEELCGALSSRNHPRSRASDPAPPPQCEDHVEGTSEPAPSAQALHEPDVVSSLGELFGATALYGSITSSPSSSPRAAPEDTTGTPSPVHCLSSSSVPVIWVHKTPENQPGVYHIRTDRWGSFHTYPDLGGPFQSLNDAEDAISSHLSKLYPPVKYHELAGESYVDRMIREKLYWPDGSRKKCSKAQAFENVKNRMNQLAKVILDMYNDDHNLSEDLSYELKGVINFEPIVEGHRWFDHLNFTATKGSNGLDSQIDYLFFAEAMSLEGQKDYMATCCCLLSSDDNGNCYTCKIGNKSMKHPSDVNSYVGGHCYINGIYDTVVSSDSEEDEDEEEQRLRKMYQMHGKSFLVEIISAAAFPLRAALLLFLSSPSPRLSLPMNPSSSSSGRGGASGYHSKSFASPNPRGGGGGGGGRGRGGGGRGGRGGDGGDRVDALGRLLTRVLRHMASELNLEMRTDGYVRVRDLLNLNLQTFARIPLKSHTVDEIREAVRRDSKQRFSLLEEDGELLIRANQGHTVTTVTSESLLKPILSADEVSGMKNLDSILQHGLKRMARLHVHFSSGLPTDGGVISGMRQSANIFIYLDVAKALQDGMKLYISDNKVILTEGFDGVVPVKYFEKIETWPGRAPIPFQK
uniref:2'-phosphotransferase n=1 Tax=Leersia perrieri TaxID=77586 RepID=A0A0D9WLH0_9ORYZ